jgi:GTP cyclohydrolase I
MTARRCMDESSIAEIEVCFDKILKQIHGLSELATLPENVRETPYRVAKLYGELFSNKPDPCSLIKLFETKVDELVCKLNIEYYSFCEHHMVPFFGVAHIAYLPNGNVIGISKLKRIVDYFAHWPCTQEELTNDIADFLYNKMLPRDEPNNEYYSQYEHDFHPQGVMVIMTGTHLCEIMRGARNCQDSKMVTSAIRGKFLSEPALKEEFMQMLELR